VTDVALSFRPVDVAVSATGLPGLRGTPPARDVDELLAAVAAGYGQAVAEVTATWLASGRRSSPATRTAYARDVSWWLAWCAARGRHPTEAGPVDADQYAAATSATGLARSTVARRLAAVSSWYAYLVRARLVPSNPFQGMERPAPGRESATRGLSREELAAMLAHARDRESARTHALLWTLYATGARVGSLLAADVTALGVDTGHRVLDLIAKGGQRRRLVLPPPAAHAIDVYLAERGHPTTGPLFATRSGRRLDEPYVLRLIRRVARAAGVAHAEQLSPHSIRHTTATHALDAGAPLHAVQDLLGHADPRTTRRYDRARRSLGRSPAYRLAEVVTTALDQLEDR